MENKDSFDKNYNIICLLHKYPFVSSFLVKNIKDHKEYFADVFINCFAFSQNKK